MLAGSHVKDITVDREKSTADGVMVKDGTLYAMQKDADLGWIAGGVAYVDREISVGYRQKVNATVAYNGQGTGIAISWDTNGITNSNKFVLPGIGNVVIKDGVLQGYGDNKATTELKLKEVKLKEM